MSTAVESRLPRPLRPFETRQYRLLALGLVLAMFSDGIWTVGLVWQVIALGGGPGTVSLATGIAAVGMVVSTLAGGVLADRVSQRFIMIGLEVAKLAAFLTIGITAFTGVLTIPLLVCAALVGGVTTGMYYPAYSALLPSIVPPTQLQAANGIEGFFRPIVFQAIGPMTAGGVIAIASPGAAIVLAGIAAIASGGCYLAMKPVKARERTEEVDGHPVKTVMSDLAEGFRYVWHTPWLWATLFFASLLVLCTMGPIEVLVPFVLRERVDGGAGDHSLVLAAFGIGAAMASVVFAAIPMPRRYLSIMFGLFGISSVPLVIMGLGQQTWMFILAAFLIGICLDGPMVLWGTMLQRRVPTHLLGRVASLDFFVSVVLMPVSMALAAPVSSAIGLTLTFVLAGLVPVPVAVVFYLAARLWRDEIAHPLNVSDEVVIETVNERSSIG